MLSSELSAVSSGLNHWIEVDLGALESNVQALRQAVQPSGLIGVVKANAYGHGAHTALALQGMGLEGLAVAWVSEAVALRRAGVTCRVLAMEHVTQAEVAAVVRDEIEVCCHSLALGKLLALRAQQSGGSVRVHIKVDTGLHRFGLSVNEAVVLAEALRLLPGIEVVGLWTHMANADEPDDSFSDAQNAVFAAAVEALPWIPFRHVANSATGLRRSAMRYEGVRVGVSLYGVVPDNTPDPGVRPVLSLRARVARVVQLQRGEGVSYGLEWRADGPSEAGLIPVGYADGWRRSLGNRGEVLIHGQRVPMIGRVCMDQFLVDVTGMGVVEGDVVTLLGSDGDETMSAAEIAGLTGTIPWETLATLGRRLPRLYLREGVVEAVEPPL